MRHRAPRKCYHSNRSAHCHGNQTKRAIASPALGTGTLYLVYIALSYTNCDLTFLHIYKPGLLSLAAADTFQRPCALAVHLS